jgi:hypothetical protein
MGRQTRSHLYSVCLHVVSKPKVSVATAGLILLGNSGKVSANGGTYAASLIYPLNHQNRGVSSGQFFHKFVTNLEEWTAVLNALRKKRAQFCWGLNKQHAFEDLKMEL